MSDKRRKSAARYDGAVPFSERKTIVASLNRTCTLGRSQPVEAGERVGDVVRLETVV